MQNCLLDIDDVPCTDRMELVVLCDLLLLALEVPQYLRLIEVVRQAPSPHTPRSEQRPYRAHDIRPEALQAGFERTRGARLVPYTADTTT